MTQNPDRLHFQSNACVAPIEVKQGCCMNGFSSYNLPVHE
jgi:hypothetical protein